MANRQPAKTTFEAEKVIRPIHTGGSVALDNGARILATTLSEDVLLTDPANGKHLARVEGVSLWFLYGEDHSLTEVIRMASRSLPWLSRPPGLT